MGADRLYGVYEFRGRENHQFRDGDDDQQRDSVIGESRYLSFRCDRLDLRYVTDNSVRQYLPTACFTQRIKVTERDAAAVTILIYIG